MASKSKLRKVRNNEGTRAYTKGDGRGRCKGYGMYCSTDRRRLNQMCKGE